MAKRKEIRVTWLNAINGELARVDCTDTKDAAEQLVRMIQDAGDTLEVGDSFRIVEIERHAQPER